MRQFSVGFDVSALDASFKAHAARGIGRYVTELAKYLERVSTPSLAIQRFSYRDLLLPSPVEALLGRVPLGRQTLRQQVIYPLQLGSGRFRPLDVLHFPAHMDAPSWSSKPFILTVLDLIPLVLRELYDITGRSLRFRFARFLELRAIRSAALILAISECTARDVESILGIPAERIRVTPLGVDTAFLAHVVPEELMRVRRKYALPANEPIILYVGGIDQRKNIYGALNVLKQVVGRAQAQGGLTPRLVIAGKISDDRNFPALIAKIKELDLEAHVTITGYIAPEDIVALYKVASVFLFLSLYEGFGLPPLEAFAAGIPVVTSNKGAMAEVLRDSPGFAVNPEDVEGVTACVMDVLGFSSERRQELAVLGQRHASRFSWTRTGELTVAAYEEYLRGRQW